jgi:twitching motility protein PilT
VLASRTLQQRSPVETNEGRVGQQDNLPFLKKLTSVVYRDTKNAARFCGPQNISSKIGKQKMARIDDLLRQMKQQGASDLHLTSGSAPYMRIHGDMVKLNYTNVTAETCEGLIFEILNEKQKELFTEDWDLDLSYPLAGVGRFRVNVFMQRNGISAVFRLIPEEIKTIRELDLPDQLAQLIDVSEGLILVTGPTGSGKSTTLASLIHTINNDLQAHIITIEDPIEFVHENQKCLISQRELASHTKSFNAALRAALREDPDIILVGEMRDLETISLAITAAETGHLVFATLHTNSAIKTVDRVIDVFPEAQQTQIRVMLSESLRGVVAQALLPRPDRQGRVPAVEILVNVPAVANLIREGKTHQIASVMQTGRAHGMMTFEAGVQDLIQKGLISREDGVSFLRRRSAGKQLTLSPAAGPRLTSPAIN